MKKILLLIILYAFKLEAQPGKEAWHWNFGYGCTIDFSSGSPISGSSSLYTIEGSACISDVNTGQLILYTNGVFVENGNNNTVFNGVNLLGNQSATQSALIVPKPGSNNLYYLFTASASEYPNKGVNYNVIDINYNSGQGNVIVKNQLLTAPPVTEKLTAVRHCNGVDYWIITHPYLSDAFYSYLITSSGINTTPVISHVGTFIQDTIHHIYWWEGGYLKASPNGKRLALAEGDSLSYIELYDFDNSTGILSNAIKINSTSGLMYGISFSPDNSKLYAASFDIGNIYQYDLSSNIPATIISSQVILADSLAEQTGSLNGQIGAIQMAPDGKLYIARYNIDTLAVINNPNAIGLNCNLQVSGFPMVSGKKSQYGLPNFIDANYAGLQLNLRDVKQCGVFNPTTLDAGAGFSNYFWSTGASTQTISISTPGKYWVTVTNQQGCTKTDTMQAYLITPGTKTVSACVIDTVSTVQSVVLTYNWNDSTTNPVKTFTASGIYWEDVSFIGGCTVRDSFNITINPVPIVNIGMDTTFCKGNLELNAFNSSSTYTWSTNETSSTITVTKPDTYWVKVTSQYNCTAYDTLVVKPQTSLLNFVMPNIVTPNNDNINDVIDCSKYQFSSLRIEIYNRWGVKVFESEDPSCIWKPISTDTDGTYFTTLQYSIDCGAHTQSKNLKGFITLVR